MPASPPNERNECLWDECHLEFPTPEDLYDHITGNHVGRKSAGTLSLECHWAGCNSRASKRDHLTSHIRVHVNLKPHGCTVCGKAFKRPQDLKKHEKIHTEEHHASHRQSKAAVAPSSSKPKAAKKSPEPSKSQQSLPNVAPTAQMPSMPFPFSMPNMAQFGFPYGHPMMANMNMGMQTNLGMQPTQFDLASMIAQQQQLNAQIAAGAGAGWFGAQFSSPSFFNPMQAHSMPNFNLPQAFPVAAPHMTANNHPQQQDSLSHPHASSQNNSLYPQLSGLQSLAQPAPSSLYPKIPQHLHSKPTQVASPPFIKAEDTPSPASSAHSLHSDFTHRSSSHTSFNSVSPRVPSLASPGSSSSQDESSDAASRQSHHGSVLAGTKRGFADAAGEFLGEFKNKRFQDWNQIGDHLDHLSNFLVPDDQQHDPSAFATATHSHSSSYSSSDSPHSDLSRPEIDSINELLLSLGQSLEESTKAAPQNPHHHASDFDKGLSTGGSLYPSLPNEPRQFAQLPNRAMPPSGAFDEVRQSKPSAPATLASGDYRAPQYRTIERLMRAPPVSYTRGGDVDEAGSRYSASLRSTSDERDDKSASSEDQPRPKLPPISTVIPSIRSSTASTPGSLPSIHDLLAAARQADSPPSSVPSEADNDTDSVTSSDSTGTARPESSSGGVETLSRGLTRINVIGERSSTVEHDHSDAEDDENHPSKRSRRSSPPPLERERNERRLATVRALVVYFNEQYRAQLARKIGLPYDRVAAVQASSHTGAKPSTDRRGSDASMQSSSSATTSRASSVVSDS